MVTNCFLAVAKCIESDLLDFFPEALSFLSEFQKASRCLANTSPEHRVVKWVCPEAATTKVKFDASVDSRTRSNALAIIARNSYASCIAWNIPESAEAQVAKMACSLCFDLVLGIIANFCRFFKHWKPGSRC
ncbi:hypothetical protein CDL12_16604 [Handroanthus impetiginosus]|uniref:Uncharacterized protein n=1 Tax=Handroanthus impetiginosus TaxID=429701 RepID=A0A2G9GZZ6_9LAMI|nr:hypothetical protein CDL12_16604 [Handroanthus impetiginosus]